MGKIKRLMDMRESPMKKGRVVVEGAFSNSTEAVILNTRPMSYREASPPILFREPDGSQIRKPATKPGSTTRIRARGLPASMPFFIRPRLPF